MAPPDLKHVIQEVRDSQAWDFTTEEGLCKYSNACVDALHKVDPNFVHLKKVPAQNHCTDSLGRLHSVDASLYIPEGRAVDFIGSAGFGNPPPANPVTWSLHGENEYDKDDGFAPVEDGNGGSGDLEDRVAHLESKILSLEARLSQLETIVSLNHNRMEAINTRFDDESNNLNVHKPLPQYEGRVPYLGLRVISSPIPPQ